MHEAKRAKHDTLYTSAELENIQALNILIVGAGGLGCEIIKNLAAAGFPNISIIDMDTIDLTNLNRQFLFSEEDIGRYKAEVAAEKIAKWIPGCSPSAYSNAIEEMPDDFYKQFHIIVCGLDSVQARRFINAKIVSLSQNDSDPSALRPLIDGGSQGFRGQCRVILPGITACYECTLSLLTDDNEVGGGYPLCTLASIPRLPEHCIEWSSLIAWPSQFGAESKPDLDNPRDVEWLYEQSRARAQEFNISGVTIELVYGVLKSIIPAVASTNAVIAGLCSLEVVKLAMARIEPLDNYFMYAGDDGVFSSTIPFKRRPDCPVCGCEAKLVFTDFESTTLRELLIRLRKDFRCTGDVLPSATSSNGTYYMDRPDHLRQQTEQNLDKTIKNICKDGEELIITHPYLNVPARVQLQHSA